MVVECADVYSIVSIATCMKTCQCPVTNMILTMIHKNEHLSFSTQDGQVGKYLVSIPCEKCEAISTSRYI